MACLLFVMGFLFWEWQVLDQSLSGVSESLFFILLLAITFVYMHYKGIKQNKKSLLMLGVAILGALPFVLNGSRDINMLLLLFEGCACLLWVAYSCKTVIAPYLSGFIAGDLLNQVFIVPFANFGRIFGCITQSAQGDNKNGRRVWVAIVIALAGLFVSVPVIILVLTLLANSDDGFNAFLQNIGGAIDLGRLFTYALEFVGGIPIACYVFGAIYGNVHRRRSETIRYEPMVASFNKAHRLPRMALYAPLVCLIIIYVSYFIVMGSYLFSALAGELPASYTYAQYARQGFFELCGVAFINLLILGFAYLVAKRGAGSLPVPLRIFTGVISLLTCLLIITAASKMMLYIQTYGLSPLRLYTSWFMLLLLITFLILLVWHLKPFNAARPLVAVTIAMILILGLTNTNGIIAQYNVNRYLSGQTRIMDADMLSRLSDAALPALYELRDKAPDAWAREDAENAIDVIWGMWNYMLGNPDERDEWFNWNLQYHLANMAKQQANSS